MRLRSLRKLEETEIRTEYVNLTASKRISESSWRRKSSRPRACSRKFAQSMKGSGLRPRSVGGGRGFLHRRRLPPKPTRSKRWSSANRSRSSVPRRLARAFKGHQEPNDMIKYREGDRNALAACRDNRQADSSSPRRAVLHARLRETAGRTRETAKPSAASSTCRRTRTSYRCLSTATGASFCSLRRPGMVL